jgi:hypothetical protein
MIAPLSHKLLHCLIMLVEMIGINMGQYLSEFTLDACFHLNQVTEKL